MRFEAGLGYFPSCRIRCTRLRGESECMGIRGDGKKDGEDFRFVGIEPASRGRGSLRVPGSSCTDSHKVRGGRSQGLAKPRPRLGEQNRPVMPENPNEADQLPQTSSSSPQEKFPQTPPSGRVIRRRMPRRPGPESEAFVMRRLTWILSLIAATLPAFSGSADAYCGTCRYRSTSCSTSCSMPTYTTCYQNVWEDVSCIAYRPVYCTVMQECSCMHGVTTRAPRTTIREHRYTGLQAGDRICYSVTQKYLHASGRCLREPRQEYRYCVQSARLPDVPDTAGEHLDHLHAPSTTSTSGSTATACRRRCWQEVPGADPLDDVPTDLPEPHTQDVIAIGQRRTCWQEYQVPIRWTTLSPGLRSTRPGAPLPACRRRCYQDLPGAVSLDDRITRFT